MSKRTLKAVLIVSIAFNLAVVATVARGLVVRERSYAPPAQEAPKRISIADHGPHLSRCIGLSGERARCFEEAIAGSNAEAKAVKKELETERNLLVALLEQRRPDERQVMAAVERISVLQGRLEKLLVRRLLDSRAVLRPEEDERLVNLIRCGMRLECPPAEECPYLNESRERTGEDPEGGNR